MYVNPNELNSGKLAKVLAYLGSTHDGEALAALHAVRRMLGGANMSSPDPFPSIAPNGEIQADESDLRQKNSQVKQLEEECARLQSRLRESSKRSQRLSGEVADLERQVSVLETALAKKAHEAEEWRWRAWRNLWGPLGSSTEPKVDMPQSPTDSRE